VSQKICEANEEGQFILSGSDVGTSIKRERVDLGSSPTTAEKSWVYKVESDGYYCLATVPLTNLDGPGKGTGEGKVDFNLDSNHARFQGRIFFHNKFEGNLPASEWPKLNVSNDLGFGPLRVGCEKLNRTFLFSPSNASVLFLHGLHLSHHSGSLVCLMHETSSRVSNPRLSSTPRHILSKFRIFI